MNKMETDANSVMPIQHYGMGILWQAATDVNMNKELSSLGLKLLLELVIDRSSLSVRLDYFVLALS